MTVSEMSNSFDVLVASYRRFKDFDNRELLDSIEFDEYEKSLYLTKAQEELVLSLYNGRNSSLQGFEETEELRRYLSDLICEAECSPITNSNDRPIGMEGSHSYFFSLPSGEPDGTEANSGNNAAGKDRVWFITYEEVKLNSDDRPCAGIGSLQVVPVRQDEYHRLRKNPFRGANRRRALRLDLSDGVVEIVCEYTVEKYYLRYLRRPRPIVTTSLPEGVNIEGEQHPQDSEVHESLHQKIVEMAVAMALQSKGIGITSQARKEDK